jgi:heme-degrading monooxygenase HmoA
MTGDEPMSFISITRLRVRSWFYLPAFLLQAQRIARQAARADGNLAVKLLADRRNTYWTATSWSSEGSMKAFMLAKPHGPTMRSLLQWCDEAALVHWMQVGVELPSWEEAHKRLQQDGRRSKVNHPSAVHTAFAISKPTTSPTRELRFR